jgi:hypothetical protein
MKAYKSSYGYSIIVSRRQLDPSHVNVALAYLHVVLQVLQSMNGAVNGLAHVPITLQHTINLEVWDQDRHNRRTEPNNLSSIFFYFGPETSPYGTGVPNRQHDVVIGGLFSISGHLNPTLQETPKTPLDVVVHQQSMATNPLEGFNPTVETLLVAKIHSNNPTHKSLR